MLTAPAIEKEYPAEAARRRKMGELYYRPPGGESFLDVALRVRGLLRDDSGDALVVEGGGEFIEAGDVVAAKGDE